MKVPREDLEALLDLDEALLITVLAIYRQDLAQARVITAVNNADDLVAIELYLDDIEARLTYEKDRRIAESITHAKLADLCAIDAIVKAEQQDREDRELAARLDAGRTNVSNKAANQSLPNYNVPIDDKTPTVSKLAGLWVSEDAGNTLHPQRTQDEGNENNTRNVECATCRDPKSYFETMDMPCGHTYCKDCLQQFFEMSFHDESLFPPRCCKKLIEIKDVGIFLNRDLIEKFKEKEIEFNSDNRTYCVNKECSKFILPSTINNHIGHCQECNTNTCEFCKGEAHVAADCPSDPGLQAVMDLAAVEGWQKCGRCKAVVELRLGCYHITCRW